MNLQTPHKHKIGRIAGLDFARFIAFFGMVFVNFKIVMLPGYLSVGETNWFYSLLEGRAAALFVILAGVGLGLSVQVAKLNGDVGFRDFKIITIKRGLFLFAIGMLNSFIFSADILHYYGIYFIFAAFLAPLGAVSLRFIIAAILVLATVMLLFLDFDAGWEWTKLEYVGFFTLEGGIRNLFYNGWHPVIPWLAFLLFGVMLSRINLTSKKIQLTMIGAGIFITLICYTLSAQIIQNLFVSGDKQLLELIPVFSMGPVPATILYMVGASATACALIAASIIFAKKFAKLSLVKAINVAGRQTLTLYIAHIYLGMWVMQSLGMLGQSSVTASLLTSVLFVFICAIGCNIWTNFFKLGPLETVMRKITG
ncbi:MAG: DUF418 domain-containing protein [Hyphomicrobiales bacterium]